MHKMVKTGCKVEDPNTGADILIEITHEVATNVTDAMAIQEIVKNAMEKMATVCGFTVQSPAAMTYSVNGVPAKSK